MRVAGTGLTRARNTPIGRVDQTQFAAVRNRGEQWSFWRNRLRLGGEQRGKLLSRAIRTAYVGLAHFLSEAVAHEKIVLIKKGFWMVVVAFEFRGARI